ncbi:MAG: tyrosine-type recombinase/integrase [Thermoplasmata archaeon]
MRRVSAGDPVREPSLDQSRDLESREVDTATALHTWPGLPANYLALIRRALPCIDRPAAWQGVVLATPYVERFRKALVARMRARATLTSYLRKVLQAAAEIGKDPRRWTLADLREWQYSIAQRYAHNSMIPFVAAVNGFCRTNRFVDAEGVALHLECPDTKVRRKKVLSRDEVEAILQRAAADGPLYRAAMTFLALQVRRDSEIRQLNLQDVDLERRKAIIRDTKTGQDDEIDLLSPTAEALADWLAVRPRFGESPERWANSEDRDALFLTKWRGPYRRSSKVGLWSMVKRYAAAAGVTKRVTPHLFRHTGVTWMAERGMSYRQIALQTGHRDLETLMRFYDHPDREKAKEAFEAAMAQGSSRNRSEPRIASARDLLGSLQREDLLALFRELLLSPEGDL